MEAPNPAHALDGGILLLFRFARHRPAASDEQRWARPRFMKIRYAIALYVILGTGAFGACAQVSSPSAFALAVTNISVASVHVWTNNVVAFHFADARFGVVNVDELDRELAKSGIHSKRLIRIVEGTKVLAEGRLYGRAWGVHANGFLLKFDSPEAAQEAAAVMQDRGALVLPKVHGDDLKAWTVY